MNNYQKTQLINKLLAEFMKEFKNENFKGTMWYLDNNIHIVAEWLTAKLKEYVRDTSK
jgi:hypothetical protein